MLGHRYRVHAEALFHSKAGVVSQVPKTSAALCSSDGTCSHGSRWPWSCRAIRRTRCSAGGSNDTSDHDDDHHGVW